MNRRKELAREYVQSRQPMGIYQVKNLKNGKSLIGSSLNLEGAINRIKFELKMGGYLNRELQKDWKEHGEEQFSFDIIDSLKPLENDEGYDYREDLQVLEQIWLDKLEPYAPNGYNKMKRT